MKAKSVMLGAAVAALSHAALTSGPAAAETGENGPCCRYQGVFDGRPVPAGRNGRRRRGRQRHRLQPGLADRFREPAMDVRRPTCKASSTPTRW
jgi:hypothetical protein